MVTDYRRELNEFDYANFDGGNVDVGAKPHGVHGIYSLILNSLASVKEISGNRNYR